MQATVLLAVALGLIVPGSALPDGLAKTPIMGFNSWTAYGSGVSAQDLLKTAAFFNTSGMQAAGWLFINTDDGWSMSTRDPATGRLQPDSNKFPTGIDGIVSTLHNMSFKFGIYSAASSVVCSGRPGSLYREQLDAETFANWGVDLVKYDNCGEYSLGSRRFDVFADAVAATGRPMVISTEPFALFPNPLQRTFAHYWRTGNDIDAQWSTILDRIDRNAKWAPFAGPGSWNDPDMLQVGNGGLSIAEDRSHFGLWALSKSPLILGSDVTNLSPAQVGILTNAAIISVNQDPLGVQARKLAVNGTLIPGFLGLTSCYDALSSSADGVPGFNGVTPAGMTWHAVSLGTVNGFDAIALVNNGTGRCLGVRQYMSRTTPMLVACTNLADDPSQAWTFPTGSQRIGALQNLAAVAAASAGTNPSNATVLSVANSTLYGAIHGQDTIPVLDRAYGIQVLGLAPYAPEAACGDRNCQDYDPAQSVYWSPRSGRLSLAMASANMYRCFEGPCYVLTTHVPATEEYCLASVASISNDGLDTTTTSTGGYDVWGGPLSGGAYVFGLFNRDPITNAPAPITVQWSMLEMDGMDNSTSACVRELYNGTALGVHVGGVTLTVSPHDLAVIRVVPNTGTC